MGEKTEREKKSSVLEVPVNGAMAVEVVMALRIDSNHVVLGKLAFCEEAVTEISSGGKIWIRSAKRRSISVQKKKAITVLSN